MRLEELLSIMDRASANLAKIEKIWERAAPFIPTGPALGSHPEYEDLQRAWADLLHGLPPIDGWTITSQLPDMDEVGQTYLDAFEASVPSHPAYELAEKPAKDLAEYRYKLGRARRRATHDRLQQLLSTVDASLPRVIDGVPRDSQQPLTGPEIGQVRKAIDEIERLMGDTAQRRGRWSYLRRHLTWGQGTDWHDIVEYDWPSVRGDIEAAGISDTDPLPTPDIDLGQTAAGHLTGEATIALPWEQLTDDAFERLLYDLLRSFPDHKNVAWLTHTHAPDRGRDLSMDRELPDGTGGVRSERVILQAKHWLKRSVGRSQLADAVAAVRDWEPPLVRGLIVATSGRFTSDAVSWSEKHNNDGRSPLLIELWPESKLETLLAQKPHLAADHGLR